MTETKGYRKLAAFMGPNRELAIFRKLNSLNMLRTMSLQAELIELEHEYHKICDEDDTADETSDRGLYTRSFKKLSSSCNPQWTLVEKINKKVNEYNNALLQTASVESLYTTPTDQSLDSLRYWLLLENDRHSFPRFREADTWTKKFHDDLITISEKEHKVPFLKLFQTKVMAPVYQFLGKSARITPILYDVDVESGLGRPKDTTIGKLFKMGIKVVGTMLPVDVTAVLYVADSVAKRFGLMILFSGVFSVVLLGFTSAKLGEVFAATAAFAAVEVVFIGSTLKSTG